MELVKIKTPLLDALRHHSERATVPFHIPGHKQRPEAAPDLFGHEVQSCLHYDLTELPGTQCTIYRRLCSTRCDQK